MIRLRRCRYWLARVLAPFVLMCPSWAQSETQVHMPPECTQGRPAELPLPSSLPLQEYENALYQFLFDRTYTELGWAVDRRVRDTGPFLLGENYGTHPAVRIFYSPEIMRWLCNGRRGLIPDGAMVIKEMFVPPAARHNELQQRFQDQFGEAEGGRRFETALQASLEAWTVMVRDRSASLDGWFWAGPAPSSAPDSYGPPFPFPASGTGLGTCLRCHASAESESTFSSLANIAGFEDRGHPLQFRVDNSWRTWLSPQERPAGGATESDLLADFFQHLPEAVQPAPVTVSNALESPNSDFLAVFRPISQTGVNLLEPAANQVQWFPGQWADRVPALAAGPPHESKNREQFITSDNCFGCHGGLGGAPPGVTMFVQTGPGYGDGYNVSAYGEWRWSPMGLAGRDPIFYAQLESEFAILAENARNGLFPESQLGEFQQAVANTCLSCHGGMGLRQLQIDHQELPGKDPNFHYPIYPGDSTEGAPSSLQNYVLLTDPLTLTDQKQMEENMVLGPNGEPHSVFPYRKYGNLAREGISCTLCHHIEPPSKDFFSLKRNPQTAQFLMRSTTGVFPYSPPDELNGPFDQVKEKPMENALGITPKENPYIRDSKVCGTCHVINLPNVDAPGNRPLEGLDSADQKVLNQAARNGADFLTRRDGVEWPQRLVKFQHSIEQATYLEWENSAFAWGPGREQSCQDCHMPGGLHTLDGQVSIDQLSTQIATIQDSNYPEVEHSLPAAELDVPVRNDYRRHELSGLNIFLLEMFRQFPQILGVDQSDYMTGATNGNQLAIDNMLRQARQATVALEVAITGVKAGMLEVAVDVTNLVGHRFPSGVGFRRAFLELLVVNTVGGVEEVVWGSGRTNSVGVIVGSDGTPLVTEFLNQRSDPKSEYPLFQPHHLVIESENQVQIYEELTANKDKVFTTSFIHRDFHPKDNRLLPVGFLDPKQGDHACKPSAPGGETFDDRFGEGTSDSQELEQIRAFMKATVPEGDACKDEDFKAGGDQVRYRIQLRPGLDPRNLSVKATMYSQAIPPFWLNERFTKAPDQPGTRRLYYLASHLNTQGTAIENWKLRLVTDSASVAAFLDNQSRGQ